MISITIWLRNTRLPALVNTLALMIGLYSTVSASTEPETLPVSTEDKPYIGMHMPTADIPLVPIEEKNDFLGLSMSGMRSPLLRANFSGLKREIKIDSTGKNINFSEKMDAFDYNLPTYLTLDDYIIARRRMNLQSKWLNSAVSRLGETSGLQGSGGQGIRIDIPVEIKNKAFQAIFGGGTVGLDVSGDISIRGGLRREKHSEVKTALNRSNDTNFKMEQTQRFRVQGHVGDKVTIGVDQDSERAFDFENNIKLKYEGYDDEIIQSIEAGNIALSLPGTRFVTFGGKSNGLFGLKAAATLGNLKLTAIASQEKGEKKKLSLSGGASQDANRIEDYQYKRGTYYFLDEYYRKQYLQKNSNGDFIIDPNRIIKKIELYKSAANFQQRYAESIHGWAWIPEKADSSKMVIMKGDTSTVDPEHYRGYFLRLEKTEYYVDKQLGFIRMQSPLQDGEVLAVAYQDSTGRVRGDITFNPDSANVIQLRILKTQTPRPSDQTWDLEWKHVYSIGTRGMSDQGFELRIFYKPASGDPQETYKAEGSDKAKTWLELFGLDRANQSGEQKPDNLVDNSPNIISYALGELYFPDLQPFNPISAEYQNNIPADKRVPAIYDTTVQSVINAQSNFYLEVKSQNRSSEYRLGMNVIENSEEVSLNGARLSRGTDYTIDYFTGTIRILNERALAANADLEITYESNQIFQIEKKTVMGARAEYALWDESFIGATFMYLNERTLEQKPRVGKGPMRNMIWDMNTALNFKPFFLTKMANFLPFVDTRAPSTIDFEGEIAQIIPNPNTINNPNTGDNDGVAYIDDFEAAQRLTPINITRRGYNFCSPPLQKVKNWENVTLENRGHLVFYNPYRQVPIKEIWPNRDVNANVAQTTNVLVMEFTPEIEPRTQGETFSDYSDSWNGIERSLGAGYSNQTESKFLELWVRGDVGKLHIDLGRISEDIIPNSKLDTEDRLISNIRNDILDPGEDIGLDGMSDKDPRAVRAGDDFWDINGDGVRNYGEPWSDDNFHYQAGDDNANIDYSKINGTEGNENDYGGRKPDSEDMDGNGDVDMVNDYFEYTLSLDKNSPDTTYITGKSISKSTGIDYGWRQYRIPLKAPDPTLTKFGVPDLSLIEYVRIWMDGFEAQKKHAVEIAEINLVGSEWKEFGLATPEHPEEYDAKNDSTLKVTEINTHDNPEYRPPPGVQGSVDRVTRVIAKEQALVMKVKDLQPGYNAVIQKSFYDAQDYINYKTLKMYLYGKEDFGSGHISKTQSNIEFFLRFGSDMQNYYEIRKKVYEGWNKNNIEVNLIELSQIKLISSNYDSLDQRYFKVMPNGDMLVVKGKPALRNIRMLVAGVKNLGYNDLVDTTNVTLTPFTGELYLNELRLSNVKKDKGIAMRTRLEFAWADLIRFNGEINREDADFHNVAERFGTGDNETSGTFGASVSIDKFLPTQLGLAIPVSLSYSKSEATPKYLPGDDVEVTDALPDTILQKIRTLNEKKGMSVSLSVKSRSQNFFVKYLLSSLRLSYSRNEGTGSNSRTKASSNMQESGSMDWSLDFGRDNYIRPFKWVGEKGPLANIAGMKVYYSPQSFSTQMSGNRNVNKSLLYTGVQSDNSAFNISRSYRGTLKLIESLSFDLSRNYNHDLRGIAKDSLMQQLRLGHFGILTDVSQDYSVKYNPKIFSWLTPNISYSSGFKYGYNRQQKTAARSATQNKSMSVSGSLNLYSLFSSIYDPGKSGPGNRPQPAARKDRPAPVEKKAPNPEQKTEDKKEGEEVKEKTPGFSPLSMMKTPLTLFIKFWDILEPISLNYGDRTSMTAYGLAGMPKMNFQFGLTDSLGVPLESVGGSGSGGGTNLNRGSNNDNINLGASSGLKIGRDIDVQFKYDKTYSMNTSTTVTGNNSESRLVLGDKLNMPFPSWTLRINSMEKLPFISKYMQRVSFEHGYAGRFAQTFNDSKSNITKEDKDSDFRPLAGVTMSWKNGISMNFRYNTSEKIGRTMGFGDGGNRNLSSDISFTASYSKKSDFRIPLPFLKNMHLKNNVDVQLTFSMGSQITQKAKGAGKWVVTGETSKWSLKPDVRYSFSDRVQGGAYIELGKTHNKMVGDTSYKEFMVDVNIAIRGN
jgi:cell surface protein SprA